jgi:hypothetical protein
LDSLSRESRDWNGFDQGWQWWEGSLLSGDDEQRYAPKRSVTSPVRSTPKPADGSAE